MPVKVLRQPIGDIEPVDVSFKFPEGGEIVKFGKAEYREAGVCAQCGEKVYAWVQSEHQNHAAMGNRLAVFSAFSHREPPGVYCQQHDPNKDHRKAGMILKPGDPMPGDNWRPRAQVTI